MLFSIRHCLHMFRKFTPTPTGRPTRSPLVPQRAKVAPKNSNDCSPDGVGGTRAAGRMLLEWPQIRRTPSDDGITSDERSSKLAGRVQNRTYR